MSIHVALHHRTTYRYDRLGGAGAAGRPAAAGAALPHADPVLLAAASSRSSTSSTGSRIRTATTWRGSSSPRRPTSCASRSTSSPRWRSSTRSTSSSSPTPSSSRSPTTPSLADELAPFREVEPPGPLLSAWLAKRRPQRKQRTVDFLVELNRAAAEGHRLPHPPGAGRADAARRRSTLRQRLVPRLRLAAGAASLRHLGLRRALRLGLPDPAHARREAARRPGRRRRRLHRPARLVRGLPARRRLDRARSDLGPARRRGPHPARLHARAVERRADHRRGRRVRGRVRARDDGDARAARRRASPSPTPTSSGQAIAGARRRRRRATSQAGDVRLTMGGEPTFVSIDDMDGAEWNTAALGPDEARAAPACCSAGCATASRRGGLLHFGQGKWYPGEQLPRWALGCYWRSDGEPIWHDPRSDRRRGQADYGVTPRRRAALRRRRLPSGWQLDPGYAVRRYEDAWYYLWRERRLPANVDPLDVAKLEGRRWSARGWRACSSRASTASSATCCRSQREHDGRRRAGAAGRGSCAPSSCS